MGKNSRSSLDPRRITAPTRFRRSSGKIMHAGDWKETKSKHCACICGRKYVSKVDLDRHIYEKSNEPPDSKGPKAYQGGLPSLGKKRK